MALTLEKIRKLPGFENASDDEIVSLAGQTGVKIAGIEPQAINTDTPKPEEASALRSYVSIPFLQGTADIGGTIGYGLEKSGIAPSMGQALQNSAHDVTEKLEARKSQQARDDHGKTLIDDNGNYGGYNLGTLAQDVFSSAPSTIAMGMAGAPLAAGVTAASKAIGVGKTVAKIAGSGALGKSLAAGLDTAIGSSVGFGTAEGAYSGASNAAQIQHEIRNADINVLARHPAFIEAYHNETDPALSVDERLFQTRDLMAHKAGDDVFADTLVKTGLISAITGGGVFGVVRGNAAKQAAGEAVDGAMKRAGKGFVSEGAQEGSQSAFEQRDINQAKRDYTDQNQDINQGVLNAGLQGGIAGGVMGAGGVIAPRGGHAANDKPQDNQLNIETPGDSTGNTEPAGGDAERNHATPGASGSAATNNSHPASAATGETGTVNGVEAASVPNGPILNAKGQPFSDRKKAELKNKRLGGGYEVIDHADGFALKPLNTEAESNEEKLPQTTDTANQSVPDEQESAAGPGIDKLVSTAEPLANETASDNIQPTTEQQRGNDPTAVPGTAGPVSGNDSSVPEPQQAPVSSGSGSDSAGASDVSILNQSRKKWVDTQLKAQGIGKSSRHYDKKRAEIDESYDTEMDKALASAPFETFASHPSNEGIPKSLLKDAHDALREEHGITEDAPYAPATQAVHPETKPAITETAAPKAETKPAKAARPSPKAINDKDDILAAVAKLGGLNADEAQRQGVDPAHFNKKGSGIMRVFAKTGKNAKTYDEMAEALRQYGFDVPNAKSLVDQVSRAVNQGEKLYTPIGHEHHAAIMAEEKVSEEQARHVQRLQALYETAQQHDSDFSTNFHDTLLKLDDLSDDNLSEWEQDLHDDRQARAKTTDDQGTNGDSQAETPEEHQAGELGSYTQQEIAKQKQQLKQSELEKESDTTYSFPNKSSALKWGKENITGQFLLKNDIHDPKLHHVVFKKHQAKTVPVQWYLDADDKPVLLQSDKIDGERGPFTKKELSDIYGFAKKDLSAVENTQNQDEKTIKQQSSNDQANEEIKPESKNTIFTEDAAEKARALLRSKLGQLNSGIDPETMQAGITLAGYHIEKGARSFSSYAKAMMDDLGDIVKPYLKSWYMAIAFDPRAQGFAGEMTSVSEVEKINIDELFGEAVQKTEPAKQKEQKPESVKADSTEEPHAPSTDTNLESDSQNADAKESGNETTVPDGRSGNDAAAGPASAETGATEHGTGSDSRPAIDAALTGRKRGHKPVHSTEQPALSSELAPGIADSERGGNDSNAGIQAEPPASAEVKALVEQGNQKTAPAKRQVIPSDPNNIAATLPMLNDGQRSDVLFAENRLADHKGVLFTNGTGTGKTFSALGIAKRFHLQGKKNIIVVVPSINIADQWKKAAKTFFDMDIGLLENTRTAGKGPVITTYANFGTNKALFSREWDLVLADEAHKLMQSEDGKTTDALNALRGLTYHNRGFYPWLDAKYADVVQELKSARATYEAFSKDDTMEQLYQAAKHRYGRAQEKYNEAHKKAKAEHDQLSKATDVKVAFLSATPFAYAKTIDYAEGYLFEYGEGSTRDHYNAGNNQDQFFMQHFGYRMRYNKLTRPDENVDTGIMERQFNGTLRKTGALSFRSLDVNFDYDRKFVLVESAIGRRIDEAMEWIRKQKYQLLADELNEKFDHLQRRYLLEAIKAQEAIPVVRQHLALGRKALVFHDYKKGGAANPFLFSSKGNPDLAKQIADFNDNFGDLARSFDSLPSPINAFKAAFGDDVMIYNGDVGAKERIRLADQFNDDTSGKNLILVQSASAKEGVSFHDTTGKHQRVLLNIGLPTQPTTAIQQEGRIYRVGQQSDALFRYLNTGTNWERWAFASTIAQRASTAENLAAGEGARALKDAFINAFEESDINPAGHEGEGKGGKAADKAAASALSEFDRAKSLYFGQQKKTARTKSAEGVDYFATAEPVGFKMVEIADIRPGDSSLEPSAGHGAIARWFRDDAKKTAVEPSGELGSRLALVFDGDIKRERFEDLNIINKYDVIVMNPPFGVGGKTAIEHLAKAAKHLRMNGRIVALIPDGPTANKRFDAWMESDEAKGFYLAANISLPTVAFERAGTNVKTRIVVIDKVSKDDATNIQQQNRDYSGAESIKELFERIENLSIRPRNVPEQAEEAQPETRRSQVASANEAEKQAEETAKEAGVIAESADNATFELNGDKILTNAPATQVTTKKGKVLDGVFVPDESMAKAVDQFTYQANGRGNGWFVRLRHIERPSVRFSKAELPSVDDFAQQVKDELGLKAFYLIETGKGDIELTSLIVNKDEQKSGKGTAAMERLIDYSDRTGKRLVLTPGLPNDNHGTTSRARLVKFYKKFGFVESKGRNIDYALGAGKMYRDPRALFSRSQPITGSTIEQIKNLLPDRVKGLVDAGKLIVIQSADKAPQSAYVFDAGGVEGYYDEANDKLYLVSDMLNQDNINQVLLHELYHRAEATDEKLQAAIAKFNADLKRRFYSASKGMGSAIEQAAYKRVMAAGTKESDQISEFKAYIVSEWAKNPDSVSGKIKKAIADFVAAIRVSLFRAGMPLKSLTPADLAALAKYGARVKEYSKQKSGEVKKSMKNNKDVFYHGSSAGEKITAIKKADYGVFDGIFVSSSRSTAESHGDVVTEFLIDPNKIAKDLESVAEYADLIGLIKERYPDATDEQIEDILYPAIVEEKNVYRMDEDDVIAVTGSEDIGYASWQFQNDRGWIAKKLGYDAVSMSDEHGTSYFIPYGSNAEIVDDNIRYSTQANSQSPIDNISRKGDALLKSFLNQKNADTAIYNLQDRYVDLKRQMEKVVKQGVEIDEIEDAYMGEELYHQRAASRIKEFYDKEFTPILKALHDHGISMDTFQKFLHARHAPSRNEVMAERNPNQAIIEREYKRAKKELDIVQANIDATPKQLREAMSDVAKWERAKPFKGTEEERLSLSNMSNQESEEFLSEIPAEQRSVLDKLGDAIDKINNETLDLTVSYGMEKPQTVHALKKQWQHYVPLHRDEAHPEENNFGHPVGRGFSVGGSGFKGATGSNAEVTNIMAHIAASREQMIRRGEKNRVMIRLAGFIKTYADADFAEIGKVPMSDKLVNGLVESLPDPTYKNRDNVVLLRVKGRDVAIVFNEYNPENVRLAMSLKNMDGADLDKVESLFMQGTRWFGSVNTQYNIIFGLINLTRDTQGMLLNLSSTPLHGKQRKVIGNMGKALKIISAVERGWQSADTDPALKRVYDRFNKAGGTTGYSQMFENIKDRNKAIQKELTQFEAGMAKRSGRWMLKALKDYNTVMENVTRLAVFMAAIEAGLSDDNAASIAKNITVNFNRKGAYATKLGAFYAFFNASMQGSARLAETMAGPKGKQILLGGVGLGAALTLIGLAWFGDDEWEKIPEFVRERSFILPAPWNDSGYISIPMPLGFHILPNIGRKIVEAAFGSKRVSPTKRFVQLAGSAVGAFNPLGGSDFGEFIMPTVLDPAVALWRNKDWTGRAIYRDDFNSLKPTPGFTRAKDTASTWSKFLSEYINKGTGGTNYKAGAWSPTPDQIDYVFGQIFGGTGREVMKLDETVSSLLSGEELPTHKIPLVGRLYGETSGNSVERSTYYDNIRMLNEHAAEIKGLRHEQDGSKKVSDYLRENPEARLTVTSKGIQAEIDKLNDRRRELAKRGAPSTTLRTLDDRIGKAMKRLNDQVAEKLGG
jgi:hypothetical protein